MKKKMKRYCWKGKIGGKVATIAAQVEKNPLKKNGSRDFVEKNVAKNFVEKTFDNVKSENNGNTKRVGLTFDIDEHFKERIDFNIEEKCYRRRNEQGKE